MKIRTKLTVGFLVAVLLMWVTVFSSVSIQAKMHEEFEIFKEDVLPCTILIGEMGIIVSEISHRYMEYVFNGKEADKQKILSSVEHLGEVGEKHLERMEKEGYHMGEDAQAVANQILAEIDTFNSAVVKAIDLKVREQMPMNCGKATGK